ncbi:MAG: Mur ligase domain-containing protein, partial [Patescibacteria group bacterium]
MARKLSPLVHFIGIGGIGISALAHWFLAKKWAVSGSDIAESSITRELRKEGVRVKIGHKRANFPSIAA